MSDMAKPSHRITVRIPTNLGKELRRRASLRGRHESELVREALEKYLTEPAPKTAYDLAKAAGIIGCAKGLPHDLSTNPKYFEGFGKD
jgi:metal-responsive CopG/Arc/MetJ family transcriptional regulator